MSLTVVKPGTQSRRFTHINDTVETCYYAWKQNKSRHYSISNKKSYSILEVAKMFGGEIKYLQPRPGDRKKGLANTEETKQKLGWYPKMNLKIWINSVK